MSLRPPSRSLRRCLGVLVCSSLVGLIGCGSCGDSSNKGSYNPALFQYPEGVSPPPQWAPRAKSLELDGTWFVRYRTVATPFLDVAFRGEQPYSVSVTLRGPQNHEVKPWLRWNPEDDEWQLPDPTGVALPEPLTPGLWWVSSVEAQAGDGSTACWRAEHAWAPYRAAVPCYSEGNEPGQESLLPGAFSAPPGGQGLLHIETRQVPGQGKADPILHLFDAGQTEQWFAVNDDFEVDSPYPQLLLDPGARRELWLRISGNEDDGGSYELRVSHGSTRAPWGTEAAPEADRFDADESPQTAPLLAPGQSIVRSLQGGSEGKGDVDWVRISLPDPAPPAAGTTP